MKEPGNRHLNKAEDRQTQGRTAPYGKAGGIRSFITSAALILTFLILMTGCTRYEPVALDPSYAGEEETGETAGIAIKMEESVEEETKAPEEESAEAEVPEEIDTRVPARVKGIYVASKPLANESFMADFWQVMRDTELNAVVIDIKDDYGKITCDLELPESFDELNSLEVSIPDIEGLMRKFEEEGIYTIARLVSLRDPHIEHVRPDLCLSDADGNVYHDNSGYPWVNPYKTEYWDYLLDIGRACAKIGFDEVQFDYIRFCTDRGADDCVLDENEVKGRDKISIINEMVSYLYENLRAEGVFVSCDVFGTIIQSVIDSRSVGQSYADMAAILDYICPMVYPSHYSSGNFNLDSPDLHPYEAIVGALKRSQRELKEARAENQARQAVVRPWLQSFTASWLGSGNYMKYDADAVRKEIQGVYDSGYDEWILWSASVTYFYEGFLSESAAEEEDVRIAESRAALPPEEDPAAEEETFPVELQNALDGDDLSPEDEEVLLSDGPIVTYDDGNADG